jgi:hypothetical protein
MTVIRANYYAVNVHRAMFVDKIYITTTGDGTAYECLSFSPAGAQRVWIARAFGLHAKFWCHINTGSFARPLIT